ncbi:unnamed protein product [Gulo gulo]|uniref:Uncharacterized protein n=1 Tax=Gulo gulo TaxID=48420 RepID=A0A9X9LYD7_GULGU|nr:unnamed protein product [Gulo gulo]
MNKQQRQNRGRQASGTVTWPRQGRRSPRPFIPVPPDARGSHAGLPFLAPDGPRSPCRPPAAPRPSLSRAARREGSCHAPASWRLTFPECATPSMEPLQTRTHIPGRGDTEWVPTIRLRTLKKF